MGARAQDKDCASAAIGGMASELFSPYADQMGAYGNLGSALAGFVAAGLTGKDGLTAMQSAVMVDQFNRQLHEDEKERIKKLAKGDPKKEAELTAAACAKVKCYAQYPEGSAEYNYYKQVADYGSKLTGAMNLLDQQEGLFKYSTDGIWNDKNKDALDRINNKYQVTTRLGGAVQLGLSAAGAGLLTAGCTTGIGCAGLTVAGGMVIDGMYTGANQLFSGESQNTLMNNALQGLGLSPEAAGWLEIGLGVVSGAAAGGAFNGAGKVGGKVAASELDDVLKIPKGQRPDPSKYMTQQQIDDHLSLFDDGVTKIKANPPNGTEGPPGGTFVMPKKEADRLIQQSGGDVNKLEDLLGLNRGSLGSNPVRIDIPKPEGVRVPSGNEIGANSQWKPGGYTSGGIPEATINPVSPDKYIVNPIKK